MPHVTCVHLLWQKMKALVSLAFPSSVQSLFPDGSITEGGELMTDGIITSSTHGLMTGKLTSISINRSQHLPIPIFNSSTYHVCIGMPREFLHTTDVSFASVDL